jgi:vacuolar-type H+-ATPase catalytic subunit A/Vma1
MQHDWNDQQFEKWLRLMTAFTTNKKNKKWIDVINNCNEIIQLNSNAQYIGIMFPIFYKEMASAYEKIDDIVNAIKFYYLAKEAFINYRTTNPLRNPEDWLADIDRIDKRISHLKRNSEKQH